MTKPLKTRFQEAITVACTVGAIVGAVKIKDARKAAAMEEANMPHKEPSGLVRDIKEVIKFFKAKP
jgi:hypothetical protein